MAYLEQVKIQDGETLLALTVAATGPSTVVDTRYYGSLVIQTGGAIGSSITAQVEGSNDLVEWDSVLLNNTSDIAPMDTIKSIDDTYALKAQHRYIRINVAAFTGSPTVNIVGRSGAGPNAADKLTNAFNPDTPLHVAFGATVKQDRFGALILSDGVPYNIFGNRTYLIDLNGYSSIYIHLSGALTVTATQSIDGTSWSACYFGLNSGATLSATPNAAGIWSGPVVGQYLRLVVTGAVAGNMTAAVILKSAPLSAGYFNQGNQPINISQIAGAAVAAASAQLGINMVQHGGTAWQNAGVAGVPAVAGSTQAGGAASAAPIIVAGVDSAAVVRRHFTDALGRFILSPGSYLTGYNPGVGFSATANTNAANIASLGIATAPQSPQNIPTLAVQDQTQYEGQSHVELLAQILLEMKIMNQQLYELPKILSLNITNSDTPEQLRADPTIFNNNNFN